MRLTILSASVVLALVAVAASPAGAVTMTCPPPGNFNNGQTLPDGWQIAIEEARPANVKEWADGIAFYLPATSSGVAITELQCISRLRQDGDGKVVQVEARKPLDAHYRCRFDKTSASFDCKR